MFVRLPGTCWPFILGLLPLSGWVVPLHVWGQSSGRKGCVCVAWGGPRDQGGWAGPTRDGGLLPRVRHGLVCAVPPWS